MNTVALILLLGLGPDPFVWTDEVLAPLHILSFGMNTEIAACITGEVVFGARILEAVALPDQYAQARRVLPKRCPNATLMFFHVHPWSGPEPANGFVEPIDMCYLSAGDMELARASDVEGFAVGVGRWSEQSTLLCWWTKEQVMAHPGQWFPAIRSQTATLHQTAW